VHDTSDSGATVFVEPIGVVESGNRLRELESDEEKEIARILRNLSADVAAEADALRDSIAALSELDLAFAAAHLSSQMRASEPEVVTSGQPLLEFPRARHPLLDQDSVIAIDARVGGDFRLLVITGPNTGGKTVALKTMGLLTLMAQSGLHIPAADGSRLSVFDSVYADIGDEQSIEQSLSTFSGHMTNITAILDEATDRSLVLLDELGAGTDPLEGAALAEALLEHLRARGVTTVASTHYSQLKSYAHSSADVANACVEFDVDTLQPTFELTIGLPGRSNALAIAHRLGLPDEIIEGARGRMEGSAVAMEDLLTEIRDARAAAAEDHEAAAEARRQSEEWAKRLEQAVVDLKAEQANALNESRRQALRELEAAQESIAKLLRRAESSAATTEAIEEAAAELEQIAHSVEEVPVPRPQPTVDLDELRPGQQVHVESFNQSGEVLRLIGTEAEVQLGRMRVTVPLSDLSELSADESQVEDVEASLLHVHRAPDAAGSVPLELDLRGLRVADGLDKVDQYLDDAALVGMPFVHIIHGHGTGAMREAVRDQLKHHPLVVRSRPGGRGEGGNGVTVVYLRE
jgi:DNA mismatch repair protein MutS2